MNSAANASSGTKRGHRPSQANAAHAKPILRPNPGAWISVVWLASIAFLSTNSLTLRLYWLHPGRKPLGGDHLIDRRPWSSDRKSRAIDHHFRHQGATVVGRSHDRPVGTCRAYHDEVSGSQRRQITVLCQIVARFADRPDNVTADRGLILALADRQDVMPRLVQGRPDEIVHGRVDDHESLGNTGLNQDHLAHQHAGFPDQTPAGLESQLATQPCGFLGD